MNLRKPDHQADTEFSSISIAGNCRRSRECSGARLCAEHQPQHAETALEPRICCGWSYGHSRAPLVAASPRCAVSPKATLRYGVALVIAVLAGTSIAFGQPASTNSTEVDPKDAALLSRMGSRGVRVHDPSTIVKCKDEYWIFYTGRGLGSYHSKDLKQWEPGPRIFTNAPAWAAEAVPENRRADYWAPDVIKLGDRYLVYYSISSWGKNRSAIGLASNVTLDPQDPKFEWRDDGVVVQSVATNDFNTIDPAVFHDPDGSLWLAFGSYWSGIKLIELDPKSGKRLSPDSKIYSLAHYDSIEAAYLCKHDARYYLFVNWGACCRGTNSTYNIRIGRSATVTGPYLDEEGKDLLTGGGTLFLGSTGPFVGPGHAGVYSEGGTNWFGMHFYDGTRRGASALAIRNLRWGAEGWPELVE